MTRIEYDKHRPTYVLFFIVCDCRKFLYTMTIRQLPVWITIVISIINQLCRHGCFCHHLKHRVVSVLFICGRESMKSWFLFEVHKSWKPPIVITSSDPTRKIIGIETRHSYRVPHAVIWLADVRYMYKVYKWRGYYLLYVIVLYVSEWVNIMLFSVWCYRCYYFIHSPLYWWP